MNERVTKIAMAALLHDIGKFWSRTGARKPYTEQNKANFGDSYLHALWSGTFIEEAIGGGDIARWARNHHKPGCVEEYIVSLADHLASGEREVDDEQETGRSKDAALVHILTSVSFEDGASKAPGCLPVAHHGAFSEKAFMPQDTIDNAAQSYPGLWDAFEHAVKTIQPGADTFASWLALLRRYASRVPAATPTRYKGHVPDISLYEHSRVTAAIAACLAADEHGQEQISAWRTVFDKVSLNPNETPDSNETPDNKKDLDSVLGRLVCGDLSGIQEFLYAIPRKGAAKTLRARSFALQLVAGACA